MLTRSGPGFGAASRMRSDRRQEVVRFQRRDRTSALARLPGHAGHRPRPGVLRLLRGLQLHRAAAGAAPRDRLGARGLPGGGPDRVCPVPRRRPRRRSARGQHAPRAPGGRGQCRRPYRLLQGGRARTALGGRADRRDRRHRAGGLGARHRRRPEGHPGGGSGARHGRRRASRPRRGPGARHRAALLGPARERAVGGRLGRGVRRLPHGAPEGVRGRPRLGSLRRAHRARGAAGAMGGTAARRHPAQRPRRAVPRDPGPVARGRDRALHGRRRPRPALARVGRRRRCSPSSPSASAWPCWASAYRAPRRSASRRR